MAKNPYITGIGGWLLLLIVGLMIVGPLMGFSRLSTELHNVLERYPQLALSSQWQIYSRVSWVIFAATAAISISAGYRLWKVHLPSSVRFAVLALWFIGPAGSILYSVSMAFAFGLHAAEKTFPEAIGNFASSCILARIWTGYLTRSIRVGNTYKTRIAANLHAG